MKMNLLKYMAGICFGLLTVSLAFAGDNYKTVKGESSLFPCSLLKSLFIPIKTFR